MYHLIVRQFPPKCNTDWTVGQHIENYEKFMRKKPIYKQSFPLSNVSCISLVIHNSWYFLATPNILGQA